MNRSSTITCKNSCKQICLCDVRGQQVMYFTGGSIIMDLRLGQMRCFKFKVPWWICFLQIHSFSHNKISIDKLEWCGLLWCFISCLDSHSDGTPFTAEDPLLSNISLNLFLWRNKLIYIVDALRMNKFSSWVNYFFNVMHYTCVNSEELTSYIH